MLTAFRRSAPRYLLLVWIVGLFVVFNTVTRLGLLVFEANIFNLLPWRLFPIIGVGRIYDLAAASYLLVPFLVTGLVLPDTLFVFMADHTSHARGRTDLPPENYHIPLIVYAPSLVTPRTIDAVASQIDVGPTILALDILSQGQHHMRALMANYVTVGHMEDGILVELSPKQRVRILNSHTGQQIPLEHPSSAAWISETVAHYQVASGILGRRWNVSEDPSPQAPRK